MADITTGLIGYWKFDEGSDTTVADSSGNGNNGTLINNPTWVDGKFYKALQFNGSNQYIDYGNILNIGTSSFTISTWIKTSYSGNQNIIAKSSARSLFGRWMLILDGGTFAFNIQFSGGVIGISCPQSLFTDDNWHNIVATIDRASFMSLYIDSVLINQVNISSYISDDLFSTDKLFIGAYPDGSGNSPYNGYYFNGLIDETSVYNRALTQSDITALYNYIPLITVSSTISPSLITTKTAYSGGTVFNPGSVTSYGVCWSINPSPTTTDPHTIDGGSFSSQSVTFTSFITGLVASTTYYVRSYQIQSDLTIIYGNEQTFKTALINTIYSIGISLDMGSIPPVSRLKSKITSIGITKDFGIIPPKNYFRSNLSTIGVSGDKAPDSIIFYQIY